MLYVNIGSNLSKTYFCEVHFSTRDVDRWGNQLVWMQCTTNRLFVTKEGIQEVVRFHVSVYSFIDKHQILYKYQFEFRKGYSTEKANLEITDDLKLATDKGQIT